jgi:hypothetical protein
MRLLVPMISFPFPPGTGSAVVASNSLVRLARKHAVHLLCLHGPAMPAIPSNVFQTVEIVRPPPKRPWRLRAEIALGWAVGRPKWVSKARSEAMIRRMASLLEAERFDAILLFETGAIQYCPPAALSRTVANIEDPLSLKFARMLKLPTLSPRQRAELALDSGLCWLYERRVLPGLGKVTLLSKDDAAAFRRLHGFTNVTCVPYGVLYPSDDQVPTFESRRPGMIVISGNMNHPPNVDGVLFFLEQIFPGVRARSPEAVLYIVGALPDPRIAAAAAPFGDGVVVTGRVPDVAAYLRQARVAACPVRLDIGVQTKILEALAWGTPVVTTPEGNAGVAGRSGEQLWVEGRPAAFTDRIVTLLRGDDWERLTRGGRAHVRARFDWDSNVALLEDCLDEVRGTAGGNRPP